MKQLYTIFMLCMGSALLLLTACSKDDRMDTTPTDGWVTLRLKLDMSDEQTTRVTATEKEKAVNDVHVLLFEQTEEQEDGTGKLMGVAQSFESETIEKDGQGTLTVHTAVPVGAICQVVVLANAKTLLAKHALVPGTTTYNDVATYLSLDTDATEYVKSNGIPMYGEASYQAPDEKDAEDEALSVQIYRMLAKIEVKTAENAAFTLTAVHQCNYRPEGLVMFKIPEAWDSGYTAPCLPVGNITTTTETTYTSTTGDPVVFYSVEQQDVTEEYSDPYWNESHCLVVEGQYNNTTPNKFYRIDFRDNTEAMVPVLRNHHYQITIDDAHASGHATLADALNSVPAKGDALKITDWSSGKTATYDDTNLPYYCTINYGNPVTASTGGTAVRLETNIMTPWKATGTGSTVTPDNGTGTQNITVKCTTTGTIKIVFERATFYFTVTKK